MNPNTNAAYMRIDATKKSGTAQKEYLTTKHDAQAVKQYKRTQKEKNK